MRNRYWKPFGVAALISVAAMGSQGVGAANDVPNTTTYVDSWNVDSNNTGLDDTWARNPERGFYGFPGQCTFDDANLQSYRELGMTLVKCVLLLPHDEDDISDEIAYLNEKAQIARRNGFKMILRFSYGPTEDAAGNETVFVQPPMTRVRTHLEALRPFFADNSRLVAVVQSGLVGRWGEGSLRKPPPPPALPPDGGSLDDFGFDGEYSPTQQNNREEIVTRLLELHPNRSVQVRTPRMKAMMFGTTPDPQSRVGHHNDCFLRTPVEEGPYELDDQVDSDTFVFRLPHVYHGPDWTETTPWTIEEQQAYLAEDTRWVPMGGETCIPSSNGSPSSRAACTPAKAEIARFHYTFLSRHWHPKVVELWEQPGGCIREIEQLLGYRLSLTSITYPAAVVRDAATEIAMSFKNTGWSSPINPRPMYLALRNTSTGVIHQIPLNWDAQNILPGEPVTLAQSAFRIPSTVPIGQYRMLLNLRDVSPTLSTQPVPGNRGMNRFFAIRLATWRHTTAGLVDTWELHTGLHNLGILLQVN